MKQKFFLVLLVSTVIAVCSPAYAGPRYRTNSKPVPKPTPVMKPKADTITSVSANSITITHTQIKLPAKQTRSRAGAEEVTSTKTYKITAATSAEINGSNSKVEMLKPGMEVSIVSGGTSSLEPDKSIAGIAAHIVAHDAK